MRSKYVTIWPMLMAFMGSGEVVHANEPPLADAGRARYAGPDPVQLDGTASHDPDDSGTLTYAWRQLSGPAVEIAGAETATPLVSGFVQTSSIQEFEFELVVSDGELTSEADTTRVVVVPRFGETNFHLENESFDPRKPTLVYFGGGNCDKGTVRWAACPFATPEWLSRGNIICFPQGYTSPYAPYGHMLIAYLSARAPDYEQPIQTFGWSTGGGPAMEVGTLLNKTYRDARYAVNRVTLLEVQYCRRYTQSVRAFLDSAVGGEPCWVDNYVSTAFFQSPGDAQWSSYPGVLTVWFDAADDTSIDFWDRHPLARDWYSDSLTGADMNDFNGGVVAGAYWSVLGPGKNLQLAMTPDQEVYKFEWFGWTPNGHMELSDPARSPGRLPEPVMLAESLSAADGGFVLTCEESENAVGYELLIGSHPGQVMDFEVISDTPLPPTEAIAAPPSGDIWWTVRVRDAHGSTIHADPVRLDVSGSRGVFLRGDTNGDGEVDLADVLRSVCVLFRGFCLVPRGGGELECPDAADSNDDGGFNLADLVYGVSFVFGDGPPPAPPFPSCGEDVTDDALHCVSSPGCSG